MHSRVLGARAERRFPNRLRALGGVSGHLENGQQQCVGIGSRPGGIWKLLRLRTAALRRRLHSVKPVIDTNPAAVKPIPHPLRPAEAAKQEYAPEYPQSHIDRLRHRRDVQAPVHQGRGTAVAAAGQQERREKRL